MNNKHNKKEILRVVVGSQAHGLATASSDTDYKSVFVYSTKSLLQLDSPSSFTSEEGNSFELKHFLNLATKSNPTILEMFKTPMASANNREGRELLSLFPYVWSSKGVFDSFNGYSHNQKKKMIDNKLPKTRNNKFAVAHLRTLISGIELLQTNDFDVKIKDDYLFLSLPFPNGYMSWRDFLMDIKEGRKTLGDVMSMSEVLEDRIVEVYENNKNKVSNIEVINNYLLQVRINDYLLNDFNE